MKRYITFIFLSLCFVILLTACESDEQKAANKATIEMNEARKKADIEQQMKEERNRQRISGRTNIFGDDTSKNATSK